MFRNITPEKAIAFTRMSVAPAVFLPLSSQTTKLLTTGYKVFKILVLLNSFLFLLPLINALYTYNDPANVSESICFLLAEVQFIVNTIISITHYDRFQGVVEGMQTYCKNANVRERVILQWYVDQFSTFYGVSATWFYLTAILVILGTFFSSHPFPTNAVYPIAVDYQPLMSIVFLHQSVIGLQFSATVCVSVLCALLLLFASARFEILKMELREVKKPSELIKCMEKYYTVRRYACDVVNTIKYLPMCTVIMCGVILVFCGIKIIQPQPFTSRCQYLSIVWTALVDVFVCAWPADHLLSISQNVMEGIYESTWFDRGSSMQRDVRIMLLPQPPVAIKVDCIIPALSLNYFCSV
nr:PREDICTED: uncharacterized protein LOC100884055 [Megachile rotundata]